MIRFVILIPLAWAAGICAYLTSLYIIWGQTVGGDLGAVLFWSLLAFLLALTIVYTPVMFGLRRWLRGYCPMIVFPLTAALVGVFPTAFIILVWGGDFSGFFSPEAGLFYILFGTVGVVLGVGFAYFDK